MTMRIPFYQQPFAVAGDKVDTPVPVQAGGSVSYSQGWGPDYQRDQTSDPLAKDINRQQMNGLFYNITAVLRQWQSEAFPEFVAAVDNGGAALPYPIGTIVRYRASDLDPFINYQSLVSNNTTVPTDATKWRKVRIPSFAQVPSSRTIADSDLSAVLLSSGTATLTFPTPASLGASVGDYVTVVGTPTGVITIVPGSGAAINYDVSAASLQIKSGQSATLTAASTTAWQVHGATSDMQRNADFAVTADVVGFHKLPGGLIRQWGLVNINGTSTTAVVTMPTSFPQGLILNCRANDSGSIFTAGANALNANQITVYVNPYSIFTGSIVAKNTTAAIYWEAIGK